MKIQKEMHHAIKEAGVAILIPQFTLIQGNLLNCQLWSIALYSKKKVSFFLKNIILNVYIGDNIALSIAIFGDMIKLKE